MANYTALPAPHSSVRVRVDNGAESMHLFYTGTPEALLAAGAIEQPMLIGARTCGSGSDSRGNHYRRGLSGNKGRIEVMRYVSDVRTLRDFPGFSESWIPDAIRWLDLNPDQLHISQADVGQTETVTGSREAFFAAGLVDDGVFESLRRWVDVRSVDGYKASKLSTYMGGYYQIGRIKLPPRLQPTRDDHARIIRNFLDCVEDRAEHFGAETQSRIAHHTDAILNALDCKLRQPAPRTGFMRLVVDNTKKNAAG